MPLFAIATNEDTREYLEGAARGELRVVRVRSTGEFIEPRASSTLPADEVEWVTASGKGTVISWSAAPLGRTPEAGSILFGIVELAEGPWLWVELRADQPWEALTGRTATVAFAPTGDDPDAAVIPIFEIS